MRRDTDRAFYQEVNDRLAHFNSGGAPDTLFLNAQNKQTIRRVLGPLRQFGIPAAAVVDLDIDKNGGFSELLRAAWLPAEVIRSLGQLKGDRNASWIANPDRKGMP